MANKDIERLAKEIKARLNYHNHRYYVLDDPIIEDAQYDGLMQELREIEQQHPEIITIDSPTQRIGALPSQRFAQITHPTAMMSLNNAFNFEDFMSWHRRVSAMLEQDSFELVCELKYDGLAVALTYQDGVLIRGATRGNGYIGEDVTSNLRTIKSIPLRLLDPGASGTLEVRGEVYFPKSSFTKLNNERLAKGQPTYANPRNTAAGSLRQLDYKITASRPLDIYVYSLGYLSEASNNDVYMTQMDTLTHLKSLGFRTSAHVSLVSTPEEVEAFYSRWIDSLDGIDVAADGVVVKVNRFDYQQHLGNVGREPRWAVAYKFPAERAVTKLLDIRVNVGRTGSINPFAIFDPTIVGGAKIKQATLHNIDYIRGKDLRRGDYVVIERAGEVIPQIVDVIQSRRTGKELSFDDDEDLQRLFIHCPSCKHSTVRTVDEAAVYCINPRCPDQLTRLVEHFVSKNAMDIEGLGTKLSSNLIELGLITDVADIYELTIDKLENIDRMGMKSSNNLVKAITASKTKPFSRVLTGLGIRHVGSEVAELLCRYYTDIDSLIDATEEDLTKLSSIGPRIAESITAYFLSSSNRTIIEKLKKAGVNLKADNPNESFSDKLNGLRFVVTGRLQNSSRSQIQQRIKESGGLVSGSVSNKTDYVIAGEDAGSKLIDANNLGVQIITEEILEQMLYDD